MKTATESLQLSLRNNNDQGEIMKKTEHKQRSNSVLHVNENLSLEAQIAERAHELWQERNGEHGNDLTDWLRAEREINEWHRGRPKAKASPDSPNATH